MNCVEQKLKQEVKEILEQYTTAKDNLVPILNDVQVKYGYIPQIAQSEISEYLNIPMAEIYGVITFYSRFTLKPTKDGKFSIDSTRCLGACGIAPVFTVNGEVYGRATVKKLDEVLDELMSK